MARLINKDSPLYEIAGSQKNRNTTQAIAAQTGHKGLRLRGVAAISFDDAVGGWSGSDKAFRPDNEKTFVAAVDTAADVEQEEIVPTGRTFTKERRRSAKRTLRMFCVSDWCYGLRFPTQT